VLICKSPKVYPITRWPWRSTPCIGTPLVTSSSINWYNPFHCFDFDLIEHKMYILSQWCIFRPIFMKIYEGPISQNKFGVCVSHGVIEETNGSFSFSNYCGGWLDLAEFWRMWQMWWDFWFWVIIPPVWILWQIWWNYWLFGTQFKIDNECGWMRSIHPWDFCCLKWCFMRHQNLQLYYGRREELVCSIGVSVKVLK